MPPKRLRKKTVSASRAGEEPTDTSAVKHSYQLKVVNACVGNHDIPLPSRPVPGALIAFYSDRTFHEPEEEGAPPSVSGSASASGSASRAPSSATAQAESRAAVSPPPFGASRAKRTVRGAAKRSQKGREARGSVAGGGGGGGDSGGGISWLRLAALCRRWRTRQGWAQDHGAAATSPSSPVSSTLAATLTPSQWMHSLAHVVLGRHSLLPLQLRLGHPCVSRMHARVVWVENDVVHLCLTTMFPMVSANAVQDDEVHDTRRRRPRHASRASSRSDDGEATTTAPEENECNGQAPTREFAQPYYLLISYGDNPLCVNGYCVPAGRSWPLTLGDVISFLENALDVEYGVVARHSKDEGRTEGSEGFGEETSSFFVVASTADHSFQLASSPASSRGASPTSSRSSTASSRVLVASDDDGDIDNDNDNDNNNTSHPDNGTHIVNTQPVARSQSFLEALLQAVLRATLTSNGTAMTRMASSAPALLHCTTGSCRLSLLPGAVEVSTAAGRFVRLWMRLVSALRCCSCQHSGRHSQRRIKEEGDVGVETAHTPSRFVVERNHLLLVEADKAEDGGTPHDLSVSPAVTRRLRKRGRRARLSQKSAERGAAAAVTDTAQDEGNSADESVDDGVCAVSSSDSTGARVRQLLRELANELEHITERQRANGEEGDGEGDGSDRDEGIAAEAVSPLRARLVLDVKALSELYESLYTQAEEGGLALSQGTRTTAPQAHADAVVEGPPRTPARKTEEESASDADCHAPFPAGGVVGSAVKLEGSGDDSPESCKGSASWGPAEANPAAVSPIKRLLHQLRAQEGKERQVSEGSGGAGRATPPPAVGDGGGEETRWSSCGVAPEPPLRLQSPVHSRGGQGSSLTPLRSRGRRSLSSDGDEEVQGGGEVWQERPEDSDGNPLINGNGRSDDGGGPSSNHCVTPEKPASPRLLITQVAGGSADSSSCAAQGHGNCEDGKPLHLSRHPQGTRPHSPLPPARAGTPREALSIDALLSPVNHTTFREVPALALHPAQLPVYVFTRRSPSPDATTTRFARQSRAAHRNTAKPESRPEYVFYYDEESQEAFETTKQPRQQQRQQQQQQERLSSAVAPEEEESRIWVDEAEAVGRRCGRPRREGLASKGQRRQAAGRRSKAKTAKPTRRKR